MKVMCSWGSPLRLGTLRERGRGGANPGGAGLFSLLLGTLSSNDRTHSIGHIDLAVMEPVAFIGTRWRAVLTLNLEGVSLL